MALLQKIKAKLGFGSDSTDREGGETTVTVEKDADGEDNPSTADEGGAAAEAEGSAEARESAEAEAVDTEPEAVEHDEEDDADDVDDTTGGVDDTPAEADDADEEPEADDAEETEPTDDADEGAGPDGDPVEGIKGIGPAYSERLAEIGIRSVADLAAADPADVAEGAKVGEKRAATWIQRAEEF